MALAMTTSFVCSEPEDGLSPDSLASGCAGFLADFEVELSDFLTRSLQSLAVSLLTATWTFYYGPPGLT